MAGSIVIIDGEAGIACAPREHARKIYGIRILSRENTGQIRSTPRDIEINEVSPELAIDPMRSCLLSGTEQLREVKTDKICLKIVCFRKLFTP